MSDKYDIGAKITLQGEREFRNAISEINNGLKVNYSVLSLVTAQYSDNANSVAALTAKSAVLESRLGSQTEKVAKLREALTNSAASFGEADKRTVGWQISLNNAETELIKMQGELKQNNTQLQQAQKDMQKYGLSADEVADKTSGFGNKVGDLANALGINLPAGSDKAIRSMDNTKASTLALIGVVTGLAGGLAKLTIDTAKSADEILTLSNVTGLSTDTIQEMNYASEFIDVSTETMTGAMRKMIKSMGDAKDGSKEAQDAFRELNLSITSNGQLKDSEEMFYEVIDALGSMRNETEKDALAMNIFGKSAQELNPLIEEGSQKLKVYAEQAHAMGYVLSPETLQYFGNLDNAMQMFHSQLVAVGGILAQGFLPGMTFLFNILNKIDPKVIAIGAALGAIGIVSFTVVQGIITMAAAWQAYSIATTSATATSAAFTVVSLKNVVIITAIVAALAALAAIIAILAGKAPQVDQTVSGIANSMSRATQPLNNLQYQIGHNALGTSNWRGGYTWVGEQGPEILNIPAGSQIYNNRQSRSMAQDIQNGSQVGENFTINLNVKMDEVDEVYKLVQIAKRAKQLKRAGIVSLA